MVSTKFLLGIGGVSVAGVGSVGGYFYITSSSNKKTFRSKYELALIKDSEDDLWSKKLKILSTGSPDHQDLIQAKKENTLSPLKVACNKIYDSPFSDDLMSDFKNFCSKHYSDQIGNRKIMDADTDLNGKWDSFKSKTSVDLGGKLLEIQESKKGSGTEPEGWKKLVFDECKIISSSIFEGEIKGYQEFCTKE